MTKRRSNAIQKKRRHSRRIAAGAGLAIGASIAAPAAAPAASFQVTNLNDAGAGSLRDAIDQANSNDGTTITPDTITFASGLSGTIHLSTGSLQIKYPLAIEGPGMDKLAVSADGTSDVFEVSPDSPSSSKYQNSISDLTITGGNGPASSPLDSAGGVNNVDTDLTLDHVDVVGNTTSLTGGGPYGAGGVSAYFGRTTITGSKVRDNTAPNSFGAGIGQISGQLDVTRSIISGNVAGDSGGALLAYGGTTQIANSTISGNRTQAGNILAAGNVTLVNSTVTGNSASDVGGGIAFYPYSGGGLHVISSTVAGNSAANTGGGIANYGSTGSAELQNSIVAGNTAPTGPDLNGSFDSAFSLIKNTAGATINQTIAGSDVTGVDPQLGPLANNGGPTPTLLPANTSPVIEKGRSFDLSTDQRSFRRPIDFPNIANSGAEGADGADIGAVELQPNSDFTLGKLKRKKRKGTAKLSANNPGPGSGTFVVSGKGLKTRQVGSKGTGHVQLPIVPNSRFAKRLRLRHHVKTKLNVRFVPAGGLAKVISKKVKLVFTGPGSPPR